MSAASTPPPNLEAGLLRGRGLDLGPYATSYPPHERTMLRVLADRAADRPDKPWLIFDGTEVLTFADAWRAVCRVGHALDAAGLEPGAHVGLLLRNEPEFMPAFYGPQVRGGRTVPLNADSRGPLLQQVIEHSDVEVIVVRAVEGGHELGLVPQEEAHVRARLETGRVERVADPADGAPRVRERQDLGSVEDEPRLVRPVGRPVGEDAEHRPLVRRVAGRVRPEVEAPSAEEPCLDVRGRCRGAHAGSPA